MGADCDNCPLKDQKPVLPTTGSNPRLIIIGQEPGWTEIEEGKPFVGRSGRLLDTSLDVHSISRDELHITNATLCQAPPSLAASAVKKAVVCCRGRLYNELQAIKPKHIVALGNRAFATLTGRFKGFTAWLGGPVQGTHLEVQKKKKRPLGETASFKDYTIIPTYHPAYCLRSPHNTPTMTIHIGRAWNLMRNKIQEWKWPNFYLWPTSSALAALAKMELSDEDISVDIETQGLNPREDKIMCIGVSNGDTTVCLPWEGYHSGKNGVVRSLWETDTGKACYDAMVRLLTTKRLVAHNGAHDITGLNVQWNLGISDEQYHFDTLLAHAVAAPRMPHGLGHVAGIEYHCPAWKAEFGDETDLKGSAKFSQRKEERLRQYCAQDTYMTKLLQKRLSMRLDQTHRGWEQMALMMDKMRAGMKMTDVGVKVGLSRLEVHRRDFTQRVEESRRDFVEVADNATTGRGKLAKSSPSSTKDVNPNSPSQVGELFFKVLGASPTKRTDSGAASVDEEVLNDLCSSYNERVRVAARSLLRYRRWSKLLRTYVNGLPRDADEVVHAEWKVWGTRTGRWASSPNLQNIPKPKYSVDEAGRKRLAVPGLRDLFVPRPGMHLVECDYSQLELRIIALLAGDTSLLEAYRKGKDVHQENANALFQRQKASKEERALAKTFVYAVNYGGTPTEIWKRLVIDFPQLTLTLVDYLHDRWFDIHKEIAQWQQRLLLNAAEKKYVECPLSGRRQYYPDGKIDRNEVLNFPIQGTGADIMDPALVRIAKRVDWKDQKILLQVHDALIGEASNWVDLARVFKEEMERPVTLEGKTMVFPVDVQASMVDWGNMVEAEI